MGQEGLKTFISYSILHIHMRSKAQTGKSYPWQSTGNVECQWNSVNSFALRNIFASTRADKYPYFRKGSREMKQIAVRVLALPAEFFDVPFCTVSNSVAIEITRQEAMH